MAHLSIRKTELADETIEPTIERGVSSRPNLYFVILGCCVGAFNVISAILAIRGMWLNGYDGFVHASVSFIFIISLFLLVFVNRFVEVSENV